MHVHTSRQISVVIGISAARLVPPQEERPSVVGGPRHSKTLVCAAAMGRRRRARVVRRIFGGAERELKPRFWD